MGVDMLVHPRQQGQQPIGKHLGRPEEDQAAADAVVGEGAAHQQVHLSTLGHVQNQLRGVPEDEHIEVKPENIHAQVQECQGQGEFVQDRRCAANAPPRRQAPGQRGADLERGRVQAEECEVGDADGLSTCDEAWDVRHVPGTEDHRDVQQVPHLRSSAQSRREVGLGQPRKHGVDDIGVGLGDLVPCGAGRSRAAGVDADEGSGAK
mmetsp:Transcript_172820/g.554028  ORF Transcript_172820/g.554028 Transcript_172820/m.554028 type:complete len:207 (+) Transcript_172820:567-1187(+)